MARLVSDYRIRRIANRGNEEDGPDSRACGDRFYHNRRSANRGNEKVDRDPRNISEIKGLWRRVRDLEIQHEIRQIQKRIRELELQREMRKETESRYVVRDDVNEEEEFDKDEVDIDEGERLFLEQALRWIPEGVPMARNDGGPVASMATLPFVPKVQVGLLVEERFTNLNLEGDLIKSPITVGSYINFKWQNKDNIVVAKNAQRKVDCGPQDQMGRKDYEGPTTTSLDVLNSLSSKIATTKCVGAELFERFKLIAKSDRSNAPYDPGGTGLIPGETTREVKLFRRVIVTLINKSRVDVPFNPGDFAPKAKLEDEFFRRGENEAGNMLLFDDYDIQAFDMVGKTGESIPLIFLITDDCISDRLPQLLNDATSSVVANITLVGLENLDSLELYPFGIPDLYGSPLVASGRYNGKFPDIVKARDCISDRLPQLLNDATSSVVANITLVGLENLDSLELYPFGIPDLYGSPLVASGRYNGKFPDIVKARGLCKKGIDSLTAHAWLDQNTQLEDKVFFLSYHYLRFM
nr:hypothetical protein [Tanacetum cinerariifolium]